MNAYKKYSLYLILSLLLTTIGAFVGQYINPSIIGPFVFSSIILILIFAFAKGTFKIIMFIIFCFGEGLSLSLIISYYSAATLSIALLVTLIITLIFVIIGFKTRDLGYLKSILFISLIALLVLYIVSLFIPIPGLTYLGVVLFCAYISYDINRFKNRVADGTIISNDDILIEVMNLYIDIINLLIHILEIVNEFKDR